MPIVGIEEVELIVLRTVVHHPLAKDGHAQLHPLGVHRKHDLEATACAIPDRGTANPEIRGHLESRISGKNGAVLTPGATGDGRVDADVQRRTAS